MTMEPFWTQTAVPLRTYAQRNLARNAMNQFLARADQSAGAMSAEILLICGYVRQWLRRDWINHINACRIAFPYGISGHDGKSCLRNTWNPSIKIRQTKCWKHLKHGDMINLHIIIQYKSNLQFPASYEKHRKIVKKKKKCNGNNYIANKFRVPDKNSVCSMFV